jgi:VWFA-related protein
MKCPVPLICATLLFGQDPAFNVESRLVMVPVTVTDKKGRSIEGLEATDFVLQDNGRPQPVVVDSFATGVAPIALVVAVQSSGISAAVVEKVQKIGSMIQPLITGDRGCAALVAFDEQVHWLAECTKDAGVLARAFARLQPGEEKSARMLDAVHESIERLRKRPKVRRVLLLISESRDRNSETQLASVVMSAQAAGVMVYAVTYSAFKTAFTSKSNTAPDPPREYPERPRSTRTEPLTPWGRVPVPPPEQRVDILGGIGELGRLGKTKDTESLTQDTGGATFSFARQKGLETAIEKLGAELHSQYVLSFTPVNPEPGYHRLEVRIPRDRKLRIRARPAYWSVQAIAPLKREMEMSR